MDETVVERTIAQLPIATSVERAPVQNRHYPQRIDVVKTLRYDGLSVAIYEVTELDKSLLWAVTVSQRGLRDASLKVGQPLAKAFSSLGNPVATSGNSIAYLNTDAAGTPYLLTITHNDRLIDSLEWRIILD